MEADALGSSEFVQNASSAPATLIVAPTASASPVDINGYVTGLPLGQQWDLASRWTPLATTEPGNVAMSISTAADGTVWELVAYGSDTAVETYTPSTGAYSMVFLSPALLNSVAALSSTEAWFSTYGGTGIEITVANGAAVQSPVPSLPSGDTFAQLASGTDGTIWALGNSDYPYVYSSSTESWTQKPNDGFNLLSLSVGSATNVWALADLGSVVGIEPLNLVNGSWSEQLEFQGLGLKAISASPDGTAWAVTANNNLYVYNSNLALNPVTGQTPPGEITAISAISQYRVNALILNSPHSVEADSTLELLSYGIVDQPAVPFPAFSGGEELAYMDISQDLGVTDPLGIRDVYDNPFFAGDFSTWIGDIGDYASKPAPSGVNQPR